MTFEVSNDRIAQRQAEDTTDDDDLVHGSREGGTGGRGRAVGIALNYVYTFAAAARTAGAAAVAGMHTYMYGASTEKPHVTT